MRAATLAVLASLLLSTAASAELVLKIERLPDRIEYGGSVANHGNVAVSAPLLRFDVSPALRMSVTMPPAWTCTPPSSETVICGGTVLQPGEIIGFTLFANYFGSAPNNYRITAQALPDGNRIEVLHTIPYTYLAHTGAELYDAIVQSNANCQGDVPCGVIINIPTEVGVLVIGIGSKPLPVVTACRFSIFAPRRPPDLSDLKHTFTGSGHTFVTPALELRPSCDNAQISINGFHLSDFRGDAIAITGNARGTFHVTRMGLFTGGRGVYVDNPNADVTITDTRIATGRSGVAIWSAANTTIVNSEIGPTHASGIFTGPSTGPLSIRNSVVQDNDHFGIALTGPTPIALENTRVDNNTAMDIDWGLNGPGAFAAVPPTPRVTSVTYDAARNVTTVVVDPNGPGNGTIEVWSSDSVTMFGTGHLERFHGRAPIADTVRIEVTGDLGPRFVSAIRVEGGRVSEPAFAVRRP